MPPRPKTVPPRGRAKGIQKTSKPPSSQNGFQPRRLRSSTAAAAAVAAVAAATTPVPSQPLQKPSTVPPTLIARPPKGAQKRKCTAAEDEHPQDPIVRPQKRAQTRKSAAKDQHPPDPVSPPPAQECKYTTKDQHSNRRRRQSVPASSLRLSEKNLTILESLTGSNTPYIMELGDATLEPAQERAPSRQICQHTSSVPSQISSTTSTGKGGKRRASQRQSVSDVNQDPSSARSQTSSSSIIFYRYEILKRAGISIRHRAPPEKIQSQMKAIFDREVSEIRKHQLAAIADDMSSMFMDAVEGAMREDDLVELVCEALRTMYRGGKFVFRRKADWDPIHKPIVQEDLFDLKVLFQSKDDPNLDVERPSKRQEADPSCLSPSASQSVTKPPAPPSQSTMLSPAPPPQSAIQPHPPPTQPKLDITVKSPRPDFTVGFKHSTVANEMIARGLSENRADKFLESLQQTRNLCSDPTLNFCDVRFPILVIEGKSYATGKTVFEAQNQAAVSGSCMINLQHQLADVFKRNFPDSESKSIFESECEPLAESKPSKTPIAFSICSQGPYLEIWVHHSSFGDSLRMHHMNILQTCNGALGDELKHFLLRLDRIMTWGSDEFLTDVADQLFKLAEYAVRE